MKTYSKTILQVALLVVMLPALQACMFANEELAAEDARFGGSNSHPITLQNGKAHVAKCGIWQDVTDSSQNLQSPNHGCAIQHNTAAMLAKPSDLKRKPKIGSRNSSFDVRAVQAVAK
jgi:type IV pilus biogenesis protein CpaD/CtpE